MTSFRTDVRVSPSAHRIALKTPVLTLGSCFADAIGLRLQGNKFNTMVNPFGTSYNPVSIHKSLQYAIGNECAAEHTFLNNYDVCLNYDFHSSISAFTKEELIVTLNNTIHDVHHFLAGASWMMITYGTAWVYSRKDTGEIVSNCHKMPAQLFQKQLLQEKSIVDSFATLYNRLKQFNPDIKIIVTVSPVRHIKDTLELNSVSKAVLRTACHTLSTSFASVEYFAAYEMMIDDLRDYRFYKSDMLHPTEQAEDYIWEKFAQRYFDDDTKKFIKDWESISTALAHKAFHPASTHHQQFLKDTLKKLESLKEKVNVDQEIRKLKEQIVL